MNHAKTKVERGEEIEETLVKRKSRWLFFPITWWEVVKTESVGNDICIETEHEVRQVYLNGKPLLK